MVDQVDEKNNKYIENKFFWQRFSLLSIEVVFKSRIFVK